MMIKLLLSDNSMVVKHSTTYYTTNNYASLYTVCFISNIKCHLPRCWYQTPGEGSLRLVE